MYLGDSHRLRMLLPHSHSSIFVSDYEHNMSALADHLKYLMENETAYEEYRSWRQGYSSHYHIVNTPALATSWPCRICEWAVSAASMHHKQVRVCAGAHHTSIRPSRNVSQMQSNVNTSAHTHTSATHKTSHHSSGGNGHHGHSASSWEGKVVRGNSRTVYLVKHGHLHMIPDIATFTALKFDFQDVVVLNENDLNLIPIGIPLPKQNAAG